MSSGLSRSGGIVLLCKWQRQIVESLIALDIPFGIILDEFDARFMNPDWSLLERAELVYRISHFDSLQELGEVAVDLRLRRVRIDHVISYTEFSQFGAGYLEILLREGAQAPLRHVAVRDKRLMKDLVAEAGVATAAFRSLVRADRAAELAGQLDYPVVVKPATGFGTISTLRIDSAEEFTEKVSGYSIDQMINSRQFIVEEFIEGEELYVDAFWRDGEPVYLFLSAYYEPRLSLDTADLSGREIVDGGYVIPLSEDPELHRRVLELHKNVNRALGIADGLTHLELFRSPDGRLVFSEIATRLGGGWIPEMLSKALGHDVWDVIVRETIGIPVPERATPPEFIGGISLKPQKPGRIVAMTPAEEMTSVPGLLHWQVVHGEGEIASLNHPSDWCAFAIVGADSRAEFEQRVAELRRRAVIETEPVQD
ncbi:ATP-grasp domain-containing protein [Kitasatospora sp. NPDC093102]|uniref:ATP-grasp domain-containing protein n=1 Tax=Kitasatospora sp. NPDC093102 TaxID=3155069 RepID=UPI003446E214